jgi:hypothetical protein
MQFSNMFIVSDTTIDIVGDTIIDINNGITVKI